MDGENVIENICRICLDENADLDWNNILQDQSHLTYKDCYYLFTRLECLSEDSFPNVLCRNCSSCLENIHIFISKAIEAHNTLLKRHNILLEIQEDAIKEEHDNFEVILVEETDLQPDLKHFETLEDSREESFVEIEPNNISDSLHFAEETERKIYSKQIKISKQLSKVPTILEQKKKRRQIEIPTCCTVCSKLLSSKYNAIRHEKTHCPNRERNCICSECGLRFYDKGSLSIHMKIHLENREKTYKCEFCEKSFYSRGDLNVHRRIHLGQMIPCTLCTKKYARQFDLDKHMTTHSASRLDGNLISKKKFYVTCEFCSEKVRSVSYKSHTARHKNVPLFKCSLCDKQFFSRDGCDSHLKLFHKKGNGERANLILRLKTNRRCTNLYMQQNSSNIVIEE